MRNRVILTLVFALTCSALSAQAAGPNSCVVPQRGGVLSGRSSVLRALLFTSLFSQIAQGQTHEFVPGSVISLPLSEINPSQVSTGHQKIYRKYEKALAKGQTDIMAQDQLSSRILPAAIGPDGTVFLEDGHHEVSLARVKEAVSGVTGRFKAKLSITDNYENTTWSSFGERMLTSRRMYFEPEMVAQLEGRLNVSQTLQEKDQTWKTFFNENLPKDFLALPDNPWRSLVTEAMNDLNIEKHDCFRSFFEFHLAEALPRVLSRLYGNLSSSLETCRSYVPGYSCSSLSSLKKKVEKAFRDPEIQSLIDANLKDEDYRDDRGKERTCKSILQKVILKN